MHASAKGRNGLRRALPAGLSLAAHLGILALAANILSVPQAAGTDSGTVSVFILPRTDASATARHRQTAPSLPVFLAPAPARPPAPPLLPPQQHLAAIVQKPEPPAPASATVRTGYLERISAQLASVKRYPWQARAARREGTVMLHLNLSRDGALLNGAVARSSGFPCLDAEALAMLRRAAPFPPFPKNWTQSRMDIYIPIAFFLDA